MYDPVSPRINAWMLSETQYNKFTYKLHDTINKFI